MIDPELLAILACPATHQPLALAEAGVLEALNQRISAGGCKNVGGADVVEPLEAGLAREDGQVVYPIRDRIPVLLIDEGLPTS